MAASVPLRAPTRSGLTRRELLAGAAAWTAASAAGCRNDPGRAGAVPAEARALHDESLVLDLHVDTPLWMRLLGYDPTQRHANRLPASPFAWHMDLPRAEEAGLDAAVLGLVINPREVREELMLPLRLLARVEEGKGTAQTLHTLGLLARLAEEHPDRFVFAKTGTELARAVEAGRFAGLAGLEGAHGIEDDLANVGRAYEHGLRMLGLVHFQASAAAYPMTVPAFDDRGLTRFGFDLLAEMERLGMVVDLAHVNARGVDDALGAMTKPFVVSHTACRALADVPRNLTDDEIRRMADAGGVIGIAVGRSFLGRPGLAGFVDHVEHALRVGGAEAVAIGSDWDGAIVPAEGMGDVRALPHVTAELLARGHSSATVSAFLGANALRVLVEVCG